MEKRTRFQEGTTKNDSKDLIRYGIKWKWSKSPVASAVKKTDGPWTPYDLANHKIKALKREIKELKNEKE